MQKANNKTPKKPSLLIRALAFSVTVAMVIGALLLVANWERVNLDAIRRYLAYRNLETSQTGEVAPFTHAGGDKLSLSYLDGGVLLCSASGAHHYSLTGESYDQKVVAMDNPVLNVGSKAGVAYDAGGKSLFLFRSGKETLDLSDTESGKLLSARVNDSGWLAVTGQQSGYKGGVTVYNAGGERVMQVSLSSTFVVDAAISPDCKTVAVVTMGQEGASFLSQVLFYPINRTEPSAQISLGSITVLDLDYESGALWVLGEDRISIAAEDGSSINSYFFTRSYLKGCDFGGNGFALLLLGQYRGGSANLALCIDGTGEVKASIELDTQVLDFGSAGDYLCLLTGSTLSIYTPSLVLYAQLADTHGARQSALSPNGSALLANEHQTWLYIPS